MTDRWTGYIVTLSDSLRKDDAKPILDAIQMIKGVLSVTPLVRDAFQEVAEARVKSELVNTLLETVSLWKGKK